MKFSIGFLLGIIVGAASALFIRKFGVDVSIKLGSIALVATVMVVFAVSAIFDTLGRDNNQ